MKPGPEPLKSFEAVVCDAPRRLLLDQLPFLDQIVEQRRGAEVVDAQLARDRVSRHQQLGAHHPHDGVLALLLLAQLGDVAGHAVADAEDDQRHDGEGQQREDDFGMVVDEVPELMCLHRERIHNPFVSDVLSCSTSTAASTAVSTSTATTATSTTSTSTTCTDTFTCTLTCTLSWHVHVSRARGRSRGCRGRGRPSRSRAAVAGGLKPPPGRPRVARRRPAPGVLAEA